MIIQSIVIFFSETVVKSEGRDAFVMSLALFKRNALAAPFELGFKTQKELEASGGTQGELMQIHYRDEEAIYVQASPDRVTVIFSTVFREETDRIFGKVFLQVCVLYAFVLYRSNASLICRNLSMRDVSLLSRTPPRFFIRTATLRSKSVMFPGLRNTEDIGYVTFVLFPRHFSNVSTASATISHIQLFRDYLHYHIKCSKAYMHSRMRHRVSEFQKILKSGKDRSRDDRAKNS
jgi:actin related protein 2/3 complex subunit 2